jgi:hypothetical protein
MLKSPLFWKFKTNELKRRRERLIAENKSAPDDPLFVSKLQILAHEIAYRAKNLDTKPALR